MKGAGLIHSAFTAYGQRFNYWQALETINPIERSATLLVGLGNVFLDYCVATNACGSLTVYGSLSFSARKQRRAQAISEYKCLFCLLCNTATDVFFCCIGLYGTLSNGRGDADYEIGGDRF